MAVIVGYVDITDSELKDKEKERKEAQESPCQAGSTYYAPYGNSFDAARESAATFKAGRSDKAPGPDWSSRLRYIPPPRLEGPASEALFAAKWTEKRHYPWRSRRCPDEWVLYPEKDRGQRTIWGGLHPANTCTHEEITHKMLFGKKKSASDAFRMRNGIGVACPGDKPYRVPEYSAEFHKLGSTLPLANFGHGAKPVADTFVPLVRMPDKPRESYANREKRRLLEAAMEEVVCLNKWRPATPLSGQPTRLLKDESFDEPLPFLPALTA